MRRIRVIVALLAGFLAMLAVMEGVLRLLPASTLLVTNDAPGAYPLRPYLPHQAYTYSFGWQLQNVHIGRTNNYGHVAAFDFQPRSHPVLVLGDSYVESTMNSYDSSLQGRLGILLGDRQRVYGVGVSAMSLSDYGSLIAAARPEFEPAALVIVVTDGDIAESAIRRQGGNYLQFSAAGPELAYVPRQPNGGLAVLRASIGRLALYDYVRANLKFSPGDVWKDIVSAGHKNVGPANTRDRRREDSGRDQATVGWFVDVLLQKSGVRPECIVLAVDSDRYALYEAGFHTPRKDSAESVRYLADAARSHGLKVVDLNEVFTEDYSAHGLKFDYWPDDRHWNSRGHSVVASAVFNALTVPGKFPACTLNASNQPGN